LYYKLQHFFVNLNIRTVRIFSPICERLLLRQVHISDRGTQTHYSQLGRRLRTSLLGHVHRCSVLGKRTVYSAELKYSLVLVLFSAPRNIY